MKKIFLLLMIFLLSVGVAEAAVSLNVTWQLSSNTTRPGGYSTIYLTVANSGVDVSGIIIVPTAGPNLHITSGSKIELGDLPATYSQQASVSVKVDENSSTTTSYVYMEITYYYSNSQYKKTFYVPISIRGDPILQIENVNFSDSLQPGKTVSMSFDLVNEGLGTARDIKVALSQNSNFVTLGSAGEIFINNLGKSQSQPIIFSLAVSPDASIGTTTIPLTLSYFDDVRSTNYSESREIGAKITGSYNFISTVDSQDVLVAGKSGYVTIKIANGGDQEALHLLLGIVKSDNFDFNPTTVYVGNLNSDDYDSEKILVDVGPVEPGYYPINVNVTYDDSFGNTYSDVYPVNIKVSTQAEYSLAQPSQSPVGLFIFLIVLIIVVFIAFRKGFIHRIFRK